VSRDGRETEPTSLARPVKPRLSLQKSPNPFRMLSLRGMYLHTCMVNNILFADCTLIARPAPPGAVRVLFSIAIQLQYIHSGMYNKCNYIMFHVEHYVVTICVCTRSGDVSCWPHPWPAIAQDGARPTAPAGISGTRPGFCRRRNRAWRASSRR